MIFQLMKRASKWKGFFPQNKRIPLRNTEFISVIRFPIYCNKAMDHLLHSRLKYDIGF